MGGKETWFYWNRFCYCWCRSLSCRCTLQFFFHWFGCDIWRLIFAYSGHNHRMKAFCSIPLFHPHAFLTHVFSSHVELWIWKRRIATRCVYKNHVIRITFPLFITKCVWYLITEAAHQKFFHFFSFFVVLFFCVWMCVITSLCFGVCRSICRRGIRMDRVHYPQDGKLCCSFDNNCNDALSIGRLNETVDANHIGQFAIGANDASQAKASETRNLTIAVHRPSANATKSSNILERISGVTHHPQQPHKQPDAHTDATTARSSYAATSIERQPVSYSNESTLLLPTSKTPAA